MFELLVLVLFLIMVVALLNLFFVELDLLVNERGLTRGPALPFRSDCDSLRERRVEVNVSS